jgi:hypothetical protein
MEAAGRLCAESKRPTPGRDRRPPILTPTPRFARTLLDASPPRTREEVRSQAPARPRRARRAAPRRAARGPARASAERPEGPHQRAKNFAAVESPVRPKRAAKPARARRVRGALTRRAAGGAQVGRDEAVLFPDGAREGRGAGIYATPPLRAPRTGAAPPARRRAHPVPGLPRVSLPRGPRRLLGWRVLGSRCVRESMSKDMLCTYSYESSPCGAVPAARRAGRACRAGACGRARVLRAPGRVRAGGGARRRAARGGGAASDPRRGRNAPGGALCRAAPRARGPRRARWRHGTPGRAPRAAACRGLNRTVLRLAPPPPPSLPPSRTKCTRLVHPSVLIGHVSRAGGVRRHLARRPVALDRVVDGLGAGVAPPPPVLTGRVSSLFPY